MDGQEKRMSRKNSYNEGTKAGTNERTREMEEGRMKGGEGRKEGRAPRKEQSKGGRKKEGRKEQWKEEKEGRREKIQERGTGVVGEAMRNRGHIPAVPQR